MTANRACAGDWKKGSTRNASSAGIVRRLALPLALVSLYVIWGSTYLAIRVAVRNIPPFYMGGARFALAGSLLYAFLRWRGAPNPSAREWGGGAIVGAMLLVGGNGLVSFAEQSVDSGLTAVLIATVPLWVTVFAALWGLWPTRWENAGLVLGLLGVGLLNVGSGLHGHPFAAGLLIFASISWAFGSVWSRHLPMPAGMMASATEMLAGGAIMMILASVTGEHFPRVFQPSALWAVAYLIVFGSFVAFTAYNYLLQHVRPALATSYAYVNPMVAVVLGIVLLGEKVTAAEVAALFAILCAVGLVVLSRARKSRTGHR